MKKSFLLLMMILLCVPVMLLAGCSSYGGLDTGSMSPGGGYESGAAEDGSRPVPQAGQLTAAEWKDLKNYDYWLSLFDTGDGQQEKGAFTDYLGGWGIDTGNLIPVKVTSNGNDVAGAKVKLYDFDGKQLFAAVTDSAGNAYLFPSAPAGACLITAESGGYYGSETLIYSAGTEPVEIVLAGCADKEEIIELMFVIDTTGSMGDEISYLKAELIDVITRASQNIGAEIRLAILLYRDTTDEYVTRYYDFSTNLTACQTNLNAVKASGGGDYPEAVDVALSEAVAKQWSGGNTTKLLFHVLDAPPHDGQANKTLFHNSLTAAAGKGIRMIPVASSGVDRLTEYLLRSEALITGGTYTFLTNDSGIGGDHLEPTTGEYVTEYLNALLLRLIEEYYTGVPVAPVPWQPQQ